MAVVRFINESTKRSFRLPKYGLLGDWMRGTTREVNDETAAVLIAKYPKHFVIEAAVVTSSPVDRAVKTAPNKRAASKPKPKSTGKDLKKSKPKPKPKTRGTK